VYAEIRLAKRLFELIAAIWASAQYLFDILVVIIWLRIEGS
jgi:hypothetical protein